MVQSKYVKNVKLKEIYEASSLLLWSVDVIRLVQSTLHGIIDRTKYAGSFEHR